MKKLKLLPAGLIVAALAISCGVTDTDPENKMLDIGSKAPKTDLKMADVSGKDMSLKEIAGEKGLLVIFSCNTCPFVIGNGTKSEGWEKRYPEIYDLVEASGIGMVLVNSNEAKRDAGDGMNDMKERYKAEGLKGYYVLDKNHELADAFGALTTPHVYLFDENMKLIYRGAIDDSVND
jgi:thioredoxin-related protein